MFKNDREAYSFLANIIDTATVTRNGVNELKILFQNIDSLINDPLHTIQKQHSDQLILLIQGVDSIVANMMLTVRQHDLASVAIQLFHHLATSRIYVETPVKEDEPTCSEEETPVLIKDSDGIKARPKPIKR